MAFRPAGSDHAVISNTFTVTLASPVSDAVISEMKARRVPWSEILPASKEAGGLELAIQPDGPQFRRRLGLEHSFLKPDGTATWSLSIGGQDITVTCNLYTRWDRVWTQANTLLSQAMAFVTRQSPSAFTSFSMTVLDRFVSDDLHADSKTLFQTSPMIAESFLEKTRLWHQHFGWLDSDDDGELLHNVNIDILPKEVAEGPGGKLVNLLHLQRLTPSESISLSDTADANSARLDPIASRMHRRNKHALATLLAPEMQDQIKLNGDKK